MIIIIIAFLCTHIHSITSYRAQKDGSHIYCVIFAESWWQNDTILYRMRKTVRVGAILNFEFKGHVHG